MAKRKVESDSSKKPAKRPIEQYAHPDKQRVNNPPVGLVTPSTDPPETKKKSYAYDPHLDPQLVWAGKAERTSFEVPTVSLHVHERIDPKTIIEAVQANGNGKGAAPRLIQQSLFDQPTENPPLRQAIDFYKHPHGWSNRLIAGDSLLVMNSLLEKEGMAGKVQMVYIDPPYGVRYGSNFQPFVNNRDVKDGKDSDLTQEPEMIRAFRDTWELGIHSYLSYMRDRLLVTRELLSESGSCFVQIGDENVHLARNLLDELFGADNCIGLIAFRKTAGATSQFLPATSDYLIWYSKHRDRVKYRPVYLPKGFAEGGSGAYDQIELADGTRRRLLEKERQSIASGNTDIGRVYRHQILTSPRIREARSGYFPVDFEGQKFLPTTGEWKTHSDGISRLIAAGRVTRTGTTLSYIRYLDDFPAFPLSNVWDDTQSGSGMNKVYVVQTNAKVIEELLSKVVDGAVQAATSLDLTPSMNWIP